MSAAFDAVVVGAGPAGLSAAAELAAAGGRCLTLEQGEPAAVRDRDRPRDVLSGVGGAGLFSDGKHSFFPSATALWTLPRRAALVEAFEATAALLARFGVEAGSFPEAAADGAPRGVWHAKEYPSIYLGLPERRRLIEELWSAGGERWTGARVEDAGRAGDELGLSVRRDGRLEEVRARSLIVAGGRWAPRSMRRWLEVLGVRYAFRRAEFGVRLEASAGSSLFTRLPGVDGKLRLIDPSGAYEVRTFCTCRGGEVVLGELDGLRAYSGRADGPPTGRSNVGLVVRTADPAVGAEVLRALESSSPEVLELREWREGGAARLARHFGERGAGLVIEALHRFEAFYPDLSREPVRVYAPVIEGVGEYPVDDGGLRLSPGVFVAGDSTGRFRGIVASMISGRYAARAVAQGR